MGFPVGSVVKNRPGNAGDTSSIPGLERSPLEKEMATHSSILAWEIPWTEELSIGSQESGMTQTKQQQTIKQAEQMGNKLEGSSSSRGEWGWSFDPEW